MAIFKNTDELTTDIIRSALAENSHELSAAREAAALFKRLQGADAEVLRLQKEGAELTEALSKAHSREEAAAKAAREAAYRNMTVTTVLPDKESGALKATFKISWEAPTYNSSTRQSEWVLHSADSFDAVDGRVYAYMMEFKPELIPAVIMELAPHDHQLAMERYFTAKRRGFISISI